MASTFLCFSIFENNPPPTPPPHLFSFFNSPLPFSWENLAKELRKVENIAIIKSIIENAQCPVSHCERKYIFICLVEKFWCVLYILICLTSHVLYLNKACSTLLYTVLKLYLQDISCVYCAWTKTAVDHLYKRKVYLYCTVIVLYLQDITLDCTWTIFEVKFLCCTCAIHLSMYSTLTIPTSGASFFCIKNSVL